MSCLLPSIWKQHYEGGTLFPQGAWNNSRGANGWVAPEDCSPRAPADPDVRISRIRLPMSRALLRDGRRFAPPLVEAAGTGPAASGSLPTPMISEPTPL